MGYEVLTAFFLEAGFLGVMLFGLTRVGPRLHFFATLMVALGTFMSAFWILAVNSWMQTPTGHAINDGGQFVPVDWWAIIFNPSFPVPAGAHAARRVPDHGASSSAARRRGTCCATTRNRLAHHVLDGDVDGGDRRAACRSSRATCTASTRCEHQPAKVAAMEGHFETHAGAPLILFGWPDMEQERTLYAVEVPKLGSLILTHDWNGTVRGPEGMAARRSAPTRPSCSGASA